MTTSNNDKGFGIVGIVLIVAAVGLISASGWFVFKANNRSPVASENPEANPTEESTQELKEQIEDIAANTTQIDIPEEEIEEDLAAITEPDNENKTLTWTSSGLKFNVRYPRSWEGGRSFVAPSAVTLTNPSQKFSINYADNVWMDDDCDKRSKLTATGFEKVDNIESSRQVYLVEYTESKASNFKGFALTDWQGKEPIIGAESTYCPSFMPSFLAKDGVSRSWFFMHSYNAENNNLSDDEFYSLPEVQVIREIMLSSGY